MKIDDRPIPPSVVLVWHTALGRLPDAQLRHLASEQKLAAGFRPNKIPADVARSRLRAALEGYTDLPEAIRLSLCAISPSSALLEPLSDEWITAHADRLAHGLGMAETIAALLLNGRASLRQHALAMLNDWNGQEPDAESQHKARAELSAVLLPLVQALQTLSLSPTDGSAPTVIPTTTDTTSSTALPGRTARPQGERQLVLALRDKRRGAAALARELGTLRQEADRWLSERKLLQPALEQALQRAQQAEADSAHMRQDMESLVQQRVQALLDARLLPWLTPAESLATTVEDHCGQELLQEAEQLLAEQAAIDRRYGLRRALQAELTDCRQMQARLVEAQTESLRPLPRLVPLQQELQQRIDTLQRQLVSPSDHRPTTAPGLARLQQAMAQASSLEQLSTIRRALGATEPLGLLDAQERQQAFAQLTDLASRLYARQGICRSTAQDREGLKNLPLYAMQSSLALGQAATLVVDGHNVLFTLPSVFRPYFENGHPGAQARHALEQRLAALARQHPRLHIQLWFDGGTVSERSVGEGLRVRFSGGSGSNRADRQILAFLHHLNSASPDQIRAVVTADQDQARAAERTGAMVMAPEELGLWLGERGG